MGKEAKESKRGDYELLQQKTPTSQTRKEPAVGNHSSPGGYSSSGGYSSGDRGGGSDDSGLGLLVLLGLMALIFFKGCG